jgi:uncharacterized protein involved in exopolysaccharide biosynthesis
MNGAAGLAAQFGVSVPGADLTQTPDFYAALIRSDYLLGRLVETPFRIVNSQGDTIRANLITIYGADGLAWRRAREVTIASLRRDLGIGTDIKTGVVRIDAHAGDPFLAWQIASRTLELVNEFNANTRRSRAGQERRFVSTRVDDAYSEMRDAERGMQRFLEQNRDWSNSPLLVLEHDRLATEITLRRQLYASLKQKFEDARVEEARDTPVIALLERAGIPARPDRRYLLYKGVGSVILGTVLATLIVLGRAMVGQQRNASPEQFNELSVLWREAVVDVKRPLKRMWRLVRPASERSVS